MRDIIFIFTMLSHSVLTVLSVKHRTRLPRTRKPRKKCERVCRAACDTSSVRLLNFTQWEREEGWWWGEYTFLKGDGNPYSSLAWPYPYDHYWGFIRMKIEGNSLHQRNVFIYPPTSNERCLSSGNATATGSAGKCGIHGIEKIFLADQVAVDCEGNLAGPYGSGLTLSDTYTTLVGVNAILYQVYSPNYTAVGLPSYAPFSNKLIQSQLTTLPGNGIRIRTAQGFNVITGKSDSVSYYREFRLANEQEWLTKLKEIRALANILAPDMCAFDSSNARVAKPNCYTHFALGDNLTISCAEMNGGNSSRCV